MLTSMNLKFAAELFAVVFLAMFLAGLLLRSLK